MLKYLSKVPVGATETGATETDGDGDRDSESDRDSANDRGRDREREGERERQIGIHGRRARKADRERDGERDAETERGSKAEGERDSQQLHKRRREEKEISSPRTSRDTPAANQHSSSSSRTESEDGGHKPLHQALASQLAKLTPGFSGAELENLVNEAAILAARAGTPQTLNFKP